MHFIKAFCLLVLYMKVIVGLLDLMFIRCVKITKRGPSECFCGQCDLPLGYNSALNESNCHTRPSLQISAFLMSPWKEKKRPRNA